MYSLKENPSQSYGASSACTGCAKNDPTCFCQNVAKSPPNLIIFGIQIAKILVYCELDKSLELLRRQQLSIMQQFGASAFYTVVRQHKLSDDDDDDDEG